MSGHYDERGWVTGPEQPLGYPCGVCRGRGGVHIGDCPNGPDREVLGVVGELPDGPYLGVPVTGDAATELLALCDRLDQARADGLPQRIGYPSEPSLEHNFGYPCEVEAVWSDGARTSLADCTGEIDAALIVAAVNAVPELTAAVRRLLADRQAVRELAVVYASDPYCWTKGDDIAGTIRRALGGAS